MDAGFSPLSILSLWVIASVVSCSPGGSSFTAAGTGSAGGGAGGTLTAVNSGEGGESSAVDGGGAGSTGTSQGGTGGEGDPCQPTAEVSGSWQADRMSLDLAQNDTFAQGTANVVLLDEPTSIPVSGSVCGNRLTLFGSISGCTEAQLTGEVSGNVLIADMTCRPINLNINDVELRRQ